MLAEWPGRKSQFIGEFFDAVACEHATDCSVSASANHVGARVHIGCGRVGHSVGEFAGSAVVAAVTTGN